MKVSLYKNLYNGNDASIIIETIDEDIIVILSEDSIIIDTLVFLLIILLAIFWLHTDWIESDDIDRYRLNAGIIMAISLIPSIPIILVVIIR